MGRIALIYGALSGAVIISVMTAGIVLGDGGFFASHWFGYLVMLAALSFIFVGVKRYRDIERGGVISFVRALGLGLAIAAIAGVAYVIGWEIYLAATDYAFINDYAEATIAKRIEAGASQEELRALGEQMAALTEQYRNPLTRLPITFLEIFPVGLVVALASAALLRNARVLPART